MWYRIRELSPSVYQVAEPNHVSFYILRKGDSSLLIDSGLGLAPYEFNELLRNFGVTSFDVLSTHFHCDHIGSNHLAQNVYTHPEEWEKYLRQNDQKQIHEYYRLLLNQKVWPAGVLYDSPDFSEKIKFIKEGSLNIAGFEFDAYHSPGHTCGHMIYASHELKALFIGDVLYDGMLYSNLPDSNFKDYYRTLKLLRKLRDEHGYLLLPSHNTIPLSPEIIPRTLEVFRLIETGEISGAIVAGDGIFEQGVQYIHNGIKIQVKLDNIF